MKKTVNIKLVKSLIGRAPKHKEIAKLLGLSKINSQVIMPNNPAVIGMLNKIDYLVEWKETE